MDQATAQVIAVLAAGLFGVFGAVATQYVAARHEKQLRDAELRQRQRELWSAAALPAATRRVEALEQIFDVVQRAIDTTIVTPDDYKLLRRLIVYLPDSLRSTVPRALSDLIRSVRDDDKALQRDAIKGLRESQQELRKVLGLVAIETYIKRLAEE